MGAENTLTVRLVECAKTAAQWAALLTIPKRGEICLEMENQGTNENPDLLYKMKIGDGIHTYANLNYFPVDANIAQVVASWVEQNLDVNEYAQASYDDTTKKLSVYGIKEVDGKIVKGTNHVDIQLAEGTKIDITSAAGVITIAHEATARTDTTKSSAGYGTDVVTGVTTDSTGHVTGVETGPLPTKPATKNVIGTSDAATTDGASANPYLNHIEDGDVKSHHQLIGGTQVDVNSDASGQVTIKHETITRSDAEESAQPTNLVTEITTANGHVTGAKTINPDDLIVGIAKDLDAPVVRSDNSMWNHRVTGGTINIGEETAKIPVLKGNTIVWNQLQNSYAFTVTQNGITATGDGKGKITVTSSNPTGYLQISLTAIPVISNHVYFARGWDYATNKIEIYNNIYFPGSSTKDFWVIKSANSGNCGLNLFVSQATPNNTICYPQLIDLTKMFGSDFNIEKALLGLTTEVAWDNLTADQLALAATNFEKLFPNPYYPYNEGELLSLNPTGVKSVGFNQWEEDGYIQGYWNTDIGGEQQDSPTYHAERICGSYKIPCFPNTDYYVKIPNLSAYTGWGINLQYYDKEGLLLTISGWIDHSSVFTTPINAYFILIGSMYYAVNGINQRITPNDAPDICINLSDSSRNGTYEPYKESSLDLSWVKSTKDSDGNQLFPYGLLSVGSVHDEVGDNYAVKRVGIVDLGNLTWVVTGTNQSGIYRLLSHLPLAKLPQDTLTPLNGICVKYLSVGSSHTYSRVNGIAIEPINDGLTVYDENYNSQNSSSAFKTAMQGVMLYYELAEPVTVYFDKKPMTYPVDDLGTETLLPEGVDGTTGVPLSAPFNGTFEYKSNFKDAVIDLINAVNNYKNPVRGEDNSDQTVGQLAEYDSDSTVKASGYKASNATITPTGSDNASVLPTVAALIAYVQGVAQNALHYQGTVVRVADLPSTGTAAGDVYILSQADGNYDAGDWFIRNKANDGWDVVQGSVRVTNYDVTLTPDGTKKTIANVEGTPITVTMPDMNFAEPTASGDTLTVIDTISQSNGKILATKRNVQSASKSQKGVVQFVSDVHNSTDQTKAVTAGDAWTEFAKRNVKAVDVSQSTPINLYPSVLVSSSAPSASTAPSNWDSSIYGTWTGAPQFVGQLFVSTSGSASIATGTSDVTDWKPITNN